MTTLMQQEAREAPRVIQTQIKNNAGLILDLCKKIETKSPKFVITIGRGSSDHACTYVKYLFETICGLVTASAAPSVVSVYHANLQLQDALVIGISQSGKSPDICKMMEVAKSKGAITVAIVNTVDSPLAANAEFVIPMWAGEEKAVAATKSYIASLTACAHIVATLAKNNSLLQAIQQLPETLTAAQKISWDYSINEFHLINSTLIIARGFGFPIAQEAALKFKETAGIQAEAFSAAEVMHGPFALIKKQKPFLLLAQNDATLNGILEVAKQIKTVGGKAILAIPQGILTEKDLQNTASLILPLPKSLNPILDPIITIQAFYLMVAQISIMRGFNPDAPENLKKVTETV